MEDISIPAKVIFSIGDFQVTETMLSCTVTTVALILFAVVIRVFFIPRWEKDFRHKSAFRMLIEWIVGMFSSNADEMTESYQHICGPVYFSASAFIFFNVIIELFGLRSSISDLNMALSMGLTTFILIQAFGIAAKKWRRLSHFATIVPIITDVVVPFSMALRLFGSVFSGYLIMELIYSFAPVVLPSFMYILFTLFHAIIQSYVFMFLSMSFIKEAIE